MHREIKRNKVFLKADAEVEEKLADATPFRFLYCKKLGIIFTRGLVTKPTRASRCQRPANFFDRLDAAENLNSKEPRVCSTLDSQNHLLEIYCCLYKHVFLVVEKRKFYVFVSEPNNFAR